MSKYTVSIAKLIDNNYDFGLQCYPIFDEKYRSTLNKDILDYFLMYEIGFETPELFKHYLNTKMNLIMPKYNVMYNAQLQLIDNPLGNTNLTETQQRDIQSTGNSTSTSNSKGKNLYQETPTGKISQTDIDAQTWATNVNLAKSDANGSSQTTGNTVETYTKHLLGSTGYKYGAEIYEKLNSTFKSVNLMVIEELEDLFMGVL